MSLQVDARDDCPSTGGTKASVNVCTRELLRIVSGRANLIDQELELHHWKSSATAEPMTLQIFKGASPV